METKKNPGVHFVFQFFHALYLVMKKKGLTGSLRKKGALLQEHYQSLGLEATRQNPQKYQDRGGSGLQLDQIEKSGLELQSQKQHLDELLFLLKKEEKQCRDSLNELNQKKDLHLVSRGLARDILKKFNVKLKKKLEETGKQKKEFTLLTIFKGRFDSNKTVFEIENKIKEAQKALEQAEDALSSVDQKISNTSKQWDLMRFRLNQEIKEAQQAWKSVERAHQEKNSERLKHFASIGREAFAENPEKFTSHESQIQGLEREIKELEAHAAYCREKIRDSRKVMGIGFAVLILMVAGLVCLKISLGPGEFSP